MLLCEARTMLTTTNSKLEHGKRSHQMATLNGTLLLKWLAAVCVLDSVGANDLSPAPPACDTDLFEQPRRTLALHRAKARLLRPRIVEVQGLLVQGMLVQGRVSMLPGRVGMLPTGGTAMLVRNRTIGQRRLALKDRCVKEHLEHIECRLV
tara:strand:- start:352 stop:804 length:453 start_codon:yes stop_codon:yes gene_type:complete